MIRSLICFVFISLSTHGQICLHKNLSKSFNYNIRFQRENENSCKIKVTIIDKTSQKNLQTVVVNSEYIFEKDFNNCSTVRSYITGINENRDSIDNDFGDFIAADFNFDSKEDFALKSDSGGNGGPIYEYYIQGKNQKFERDKFLTDTVAFFPASINKSKKTLTTLVHANANERCKLIYKYDLKIKKWELVSKSFVKY